MYFQQAKTDTCLIDLIGNAHSILCIVSDHTQQPPRNNVFSRAERGRSCQHQPMLARHPAIKMDSNAGSLQDCRILFAPQQLNTMTVMAGADLAVSLDPTQCESKSKTSPNNCSRWVLSRDDAAASFPRPLPRCHPAVLVFCSELAPFH
jgi:hypothetical protein